MADLPRARRKPSVAFAPTLGHQVHRVLRMCDSVHEMTPKCRHYVRQDVIFTKFKELVGSATLAAFKVAYSRKRWLDDGPHDVDRNHHLYVRGSGAGCSYELKHAQAMCSYLTSDRKKTSGPCFSLRHQVVRHFVSSSTTAVHSCVFALLVTSLSQL